MINLDSTVSKATTSNPKDILGRKKPALWLVPAALMLYVAKVMALGALKYGPYNWRAKNVRLTVYIEAAMRHLLALLDGEDKDPESGYSHAAHVAACMGIILDAQANNNLIDDRPAKGPGPKIIQELTEPDYLQLAKEVAPTLPEPAIATRGGGSSAECKHESCSLFSAPGDGPGVDRIQCDVCKAELR